MSTYFCKWIQANLKQTPLLKAYSFHTLWYLSALSRNDPACWDLFDRWRNRIISKSVSAITLFVAYILRKWLKVSKYSVAVSAFWGLCHFDLSAIYLLRTVAEWPFMKKYNICTLQRAAHICSSFVSPANLNADKKMRIEIGSIESNICELLCTGSRLAY